MVHRRAILAGLAASTLPRLSWADVGNPACLAAGKENAGYALHGLSASGESLFSLPLPARGHAATAHPTRPEAVAFARRPGTFALVINCAMGTETHHLEPPKGQQFNGHGAFSLDGSLLMTSEVIAETSEGRIGLWRTSDYQRVGEWASGGIGPHDIKQLPDGRLAVANGGIRTDPDDRTKLNLSTMRPNLAVLSPVGELADLVELPDLRQNSIRHLALSGDSIAFAMQWEGDPAETVPLLCLWKPGQPPLLCHAPPGEAGFLKGYAGSVAATSDQVVITSPKGGATMIFRHDGTHLATHRRADVCGAAAINGAFVLTDGLGAIWACDTSALTPLSKGTTAWDNHLIALS